MRKLSISLNGIVVAAIAAAVLSLPSVAQAQQKPAKVVQKQTTQPCKVYGAVSHRCYTFDSDATWRGGLSDFHGSNGD
jgi:hypothetical protein